MNNLDVVRTLLEMRDLLAQANEPQWAERVDRLAASFQTDSPEEVKSMARQALRMFGGMGSLSDLVVYVHGVPVPEMNDRLEAMRRQLHAELVALIADAPDAAL
ncbi:MAG TPA: hypothetical protein PLJ78_17595 [Anaerolineae bacterium]|nr:hypothetical protein [Anaerolineae bacterium]HQK15746.1 hypothetical protein [Anaerolineae bacterium]